MNQNPENIPPISAEEERVAQVKEPPKSRIGGFLAAIGKTALAKAAKSGIKKAGTWLATKLGLQGAITALGAAASGLTAGVSLLVSTAINFALEVGGKILGKIKEGIIRLVKKPEEAVGLVVAGALGFALLPMPIALVGVVPIVLGGTALISWGAASLGIITTGLAAKITAFFVLLTTAPITAPIALFVVAVLGTLALITFFIVITTAGAFILPVTPTKPVTAYFEVTKTISRNEIPNNELPNNPFVTYTVAVTAQQPITITSVRDERSVNCTGGRTPDIETPIDISPPSGKITSWTSDSYALRFDDSFEDCRVCNTVTVTANIPDENRTGEIASDRQCVKIGQPPEDCPEGWPTAHGRITQGPNANYSHSSQEAIDIGSTFGNDVYATHQGRATYSRNHSCGGGIVKIEGTCNSQVFVSKFVHLKTRAISEGQEVNQGDLVGTVGGDATTDTCSDGPHLHYEFETVLEMAVPYIPVSDDVLEGCCLNTSICPTNCEDLNINW